MTADAGADRVLWQGASAPSRDTGRLFGSAFAPIFIALVAVAFALFVTGLLDTPGAWVIGAVFLVPALLQTGRRLLRRRNPEQRYTLTERQFIVESNDGRHAYDLGQLGELTVDADGDGTGDIASSGHLLAHDVPDAPALLQRIESARGGLIGAEATSQRPPPARA
jgi:hypothetical protein